MTERQTRSQIRRLVGPVLLGLLAIALVAIAAGPERSVFFAPPPTTANVPTTSTTVPPDPSGQRLPIGDIPGWKQVFVEDFNTDAPLGSFKDGPYEKNWDVYNDGVKDTAAQNENGRGRYFPSKVISVNNGVLNKYVHSEGSTAMGAAIIPRASFGQTYGRYSVRFRADPVEGYKVAWLLWPDSDSWPEDGEIDFPEGGLDKHIGAFAHHAVDEDVKDTFQTDVSMQDWHTATTEWTPGKVEFFLDGVSIGASTKDVPTQPMHWVLQTETCIGSCQPGPNAAGNVQIDWVALYELNN